MTNNSVFFIIFVIAFGIFCSSSMLSRSYYDASTIRALIKENNNITERLLELETENAKKEKQIIMITGRLYQSLIVQSNSLDARADYLDEALCDLTDTLEYYDILE